MRYFGQPFGMQQADAIGAEGGGGSTTEVPIDEEVPGWSVIDDSAGDDITEAFEASAEMVPEWAEASYDPDRNLELIVKAESGELTEKEVDEAVSRGIVKRTTKKKKSSGGTGSNYPNPDPEDPKWYDVREWGGKQWGIAGGATVGLGLAIWGISAALGDD